MAPLLKQFAGTTVEGIATMWADTGRDLVTFDRSVDSVPNSGKIHVPTLAEISVMSTSRQAYTPQVTDFPSVQNKQQ